MGTAHGGHTPVWHLTEQVWLQPSSDFMQSEAQVGIGSVHAVRRCLVFDGKKEAEAGSERARLPQGQWVTRDGERGQGGGVLDGG
jgi:hypothetical protein